VTDSRTAVDFAGCMRELADVHHPKAEHIRVVLDNLSTHSAGALYEAFPARKARPMLDRLKFHLSPSTPAGSTWSRSKSACSAANASTAALAVSSASNLRSRPENDSEMRHAPVSNGCSPSRRAAQNRAAPIPCQTDIQTQRVIVTVQGTSEHILWGLITLARRRRSRGGNRRAPRRNCSRGQCRHQLQRDLQPLHISLVRWHLSKGNSSETAVFPARQCAIRSP
jgi:hypothetical protein